MKTFLSVIKNQKGILILDSIFSMSLVLGAAAVVFALTLTLSVIEVAQYVAFSTSRAYYPAHITPERQRQLAEEKFNQLENLPAFRSLFKGGWFEIKLVDIRDFKDQYAGNISGNHSPLSGAEIEIQAKVLSFNVPFFGRTSSDDGLKTKVNSYLGREPSRAECMAVNQERWRKIKENVNLAGFSIGDAGYAVIADNGC